MKKRGQWERCLQRPCGRRKHGPSQKLAEAQLFSVQINSEEVVVHPEDGGTVRYKICEVLKAKATSWHLWNFK